MESSKLASRLRVKDDAGSLKKLSHSFHAGAKLIPKIHSHKVFKGTKEIPVPAYFKNIGSLKKRKTSYSENLAKPQRLPPMEEGKEETQKALNLTALQYHELPACTDYIH